MKRYEGLYILNTAGNEDRIQDLIDRISASISEEGGKVETTQKMEKKNFARVANKKYPSGYYVNVIFEGEPELMNKLQHKYDLDEDVFRVLFSTLPDSRPNQPVTA